MIYEVYIYDDIWDPNDAYIIFMFVVFYLYTWIRQTFAFRYATWEPGF